jgi:hypothetical protein
MVGPWISALIGAAIIIVSGLLWRRWREAQLAIRTQLSMLEFDEQRGKLASDFLNAAAATGKPRGLRWKSCDLRSDKRFAMDASTGELVALVGATISFEAVEGGDMEEVEAVGNLRSATVVYVHRGGRWTTEGRTIFNLEPSQALEKFAGALKPIGE